jgi:hypothetical protein
MCVCVALGFVVEKKRTKKKGGKIKLFFTIFFSPFSFWWMETHPLLPHCPRHLLIKGISFFFFYNVTATPLCLLYPLAMSLVGTASREFEVTHVGKKFFRLENIKQKKKYCEPIFSAPQVPNHANVD